MKQQKAEYRITVEDKSTRQTVGEPFSVKSSNKMWAKCKAVFSAPEGESYRVTVEKDGTPFKVFTRMSVVGKRTWWMRNELKNAEEQEAPEVPVVTEKKSSAKAKIISC